MVGNRFLSLCIAVSTALHWLVLSIIADSLLTVPPPFVTTSPLIHVRLVGATPPIGFQTVPMEPPRKTTSEAPKPATHAERNGHSINLLESYLPPSKLSAIPNPIDSLDPTAENYIHEGLVGEAELMLLINERGTVDAVLTIESSLPDAVVAYAKNTFLGARFTPGLAGGEPSKSRIRIRISLSNSSHTADSGNPRSAKLREHK